MNVKILELAGYLRTSKPKKTVQKEELNKQEVSIAKYVSGKPYRVKDWFREAQSGMDRNRPVRADIIKKLEKNIYDGVIVDTLTRWGRDTPDTLLKMEEVAVSLDKIFIVSNISFIYDPKDMMSRQIAKMLVFVGDMEREFMVERMQVGRRIYVEGGGKLGRKDKPVSSKVKKDIVALYKDANMGIGKVAEAVSSLHPDTPIGKVVVRRILVEEKVEIRSPKRRNIGEL